MRLFFTFIAVAVLCLTSFSQSKISIEDAVLEQYGKYRADYISDLQWREGEDTYSYTEDDALFISNSKGRVSQLTTLEQLNTMLGIKLTRFPGVTWLTRDTFYFESNNKFYTVDLKKNTGIETLALSETAANIDYHQGQNSAAYTVDNNLWVNFQGKLFAVTDNEPGIVSGQAIARYEFGISTGTFWGPEGKQLAFYEKDERGVSDYPMVDYSTTPATAIPLKYPMAGEQGELAAVGIYDLGTKKKVYLDLNGGVRDDSFYATNLAWDPSGEFVYVAIVNRDQNRCQLNKYDVATGRLIKTLFEERDEKYIEPEHAPLFIPNHDDLFIWVSERNGFDNLYLYNKEGDLISNTEFNFPITSVLEFDGKGNNIYVEATGNNPTENHIYKVELKGMKVQMLTRAGGTHHGKVSASGKFILDTWSNLETPRVIEMLTSTGKVARKLLVADNPMKDVTYGTTEVFELTSFDETPLWCRMIKPSNFDPSKQYPVIVYVYSGPHVQLVTNSWMAGAPLWMHNFAEEGYIIFTVDSRGSGKRGRDFEQAIHRNMGSIELDDQEHAVNWLKEQPYTDAERFGVHGWSYGGFMTTSMMLKKPGLFEVGVAGGPVIDWNYYEIMYTERYMDTPAQNPEGYENAKLTNHVKNLQGELLMIHGNLDDVVVLQHNMAFQRQCVLDDVQVDFAVYPSHPHNVRGKDRVHLMKKVFRYFMLNL
jgi:dipeptidyl-peptidase 4